jgi:hypothetical protein
VLATVTHDPPLVKPGGGVRVFELRKATLKTMQSPFTGVLANPDPAPAPVHPS